MKDKIEIKYVSNDGTSFSQYRDHWELTVSSDLVGKHTISLTTEQAMIIGIAVGVAKGLGKKEGYEKAKKKYKAINKLAHLYTPTTPEVKLPWEDANIPMHWNPEWKLNDPNT